MILSILLCILFVGIALIHFHWALGGAFGLNQCLPKKANGELLFHLKKRDSALVGFGFILLAIFYWVRSGLLEHNIPDEVIKYGSWSIPIIFLLRAIGEFKYVGFLKKIKDTEFGKWDSQLLSPLCLLIALCGLFIQI